MNGKLIKAKDIYYLLCAVGISLLFSGCTSGNTVKIGLLAPFSGPMAGIGEKARNGALLAIDEVNALGGIKGKTVELLLEDAGGNPDAAGEAARRLVDERVQVVVGPYFSSTTQAALDILSEENILVFSPTVASEIFRKKDDNLILFSTSAMFRGAIHAERIVRHHAIRRVALIWDKKNYLYSSEWVEGFQERLLELGGTITEEISIEFNKDIVFAPLVERMLYSDPDAVVLVAADLHGSLLV